MAATSSSGDAVVVTTTGGCTNVGNDVTITSSSVPCVVHYNVPASTNYDAAPEVTDTSTTGKASQTITVTRQRQPRLTLATPSPWRQPPAQVMR
ncbi:MAG: hypothetical protein R3E61_04575 [Pseudomonadales bacterium]